MARGGRMGFRASAFAGLAAVAITISSNQTNYSLFTAASSPGSAVAVTVTINSGVVVYSTSTSNAALDITGFAAGTTVALINNGSIIGKGGNGGAGGSLLFVWQYNPYYSAVITANDGAAGQAGGPAIKADANVALTITNASGLIAGGGGGGGGAGAGKITYNDGKGFSDNTVAGSGGGGGRSYSATSGGAYATYTEIYEGVTLSADPNTYGVVGGAGNSTAAGAGGLHTIQSSNTMTWGAAGDGGDYGAAGSAGATPAFLYEDPYGEYFGYIWDLGTGGAGGAAGKAIHLNGASAPTWVSGNDGSHVKGAVS